MITLLVLIYGAICVVLFKLARVPANTWTISTAALVGLVTIGALFVALNFNQPFTTVGRWYFHVTPLYSTVKGLVIDVPVTPNVALRKGDVLFRLDPRPFQDQVDAKRAELAEAEQDARGLKPALDQARAEVTKAQATRDRSRQSFDRYRKANADALRRGWLAPFSDLTVANRKGLYLQDEAAVGAARANAEKARLAHAANIQGVNPKVARARAELRYAEYDLSQATITAPASGYVTQVFLRPGMTVSPTPIRPVMVFVLSSDQNVFAASFPQNVVQSIRLGHEAEIAFAAVPGRVFQGRVRTLVGAVAQGQLQPEGEIAAPESDRQPGLATVIIDITDDLSGAGIPAGSVAQVAVYNSAYPELRLMRRILLRMKSWLNYLPVDLI